MNYNITSPPNTQKEVTAEVSHREDKNSESRINDSRSPSKVEADHAELAIWSREKASIETYSIFFAE